MYLVFGVLTTVVGWAVYFAVLWAWKGIFSLPVDDTESALYLAGYTAAQVLQWIAAVLFAFFTNSYFYRWYVLRWKRYFTLFLLAFNWCYIPYFRSMYYKLTIQQHRCFS